MKNINCIYVSSNTVNQDIIRGQGDEMVNFAINFIAQVIFAKSNVPYIQKNHFKIAGDKRHKLFTKIIFNLQNSHL